MIYLRGIALNVFPDGNSYLSDLPVVRYLHTAKHLEFRKPVTFFVGENGTGKSTLLEAISVASGFNPEGGSRDFSFSTKRSHSDLHQFITPIKAGYPQDGFFLRAESFYNTATYLDENSNLLRYGGISLHEQSHGESFLSLITNRFEGHGLYILDEPEAALSPHRLLSLLVAIGDLVKNDSQFLIATHSPILMSYPKSKVLELSVDGIRTVSYKETEHYKLTKQFIDAPEQMLKYLLNG